VKNTKILLLILIFSFSFNLVFSQNNDSLFSDDEFKEWNDDTDDEFKEWNNENSDDEFKEWDETTSDNEFKEFNESNKDKSGNGKCNRNCSNGGGFDTALKWVLISLFFTILAGFLVRNKNTRNLRGLFLVSALVVYGFYKGSCPCPIMSFQNLVLAIFGQDIHWTKYLWFLGLIPITYIFGKVWCGWICHLGALQELLYHPGKVKILQSAKAQFFMRYFRIAVLITLIIQIAVTKTNIFKHYDPFKVAFNLFSANTTGWILLGLLIVSSIFIYRPFCKTICPIGLILGWITKIPGASIIGVKGKCTSCISCNNACKINAITRTEKLSSLENQECIACGDCIDTCKQSGLTFVRKNKNNNDKVICKN